MPIGTSDGEYFEDRWEYTVRKPVINPDVDPRFMTNDDNVVTPNQMGTNQQMDKTEQDPSTGTGIPIGLKRVEITGGTVDSGMPPQASEEPAGALKSGEGGQVPGNGEPIRPEPFGLNPPEGNAIQSYVKGREEAIRSLPETLRNIPKQFKEDMEKSSLKTDEERLAEALHVAMSFGTGTMVGVKSKAFDKNLLAQAQILEQRGFDAEEIWTRTGVFKGPDKRWRQEIDDSKAVAKPIDPLKNTEQLFKDQGYALDTLYGRGQGGKNIYSVRKWKTEDKVPFRDLPDDLKEALVKLNDGRFSASLSDVLDHPELFKAYPDLAHVEVVPFPEGQYGRAAYNSSADTIELGKNFTIEDILHEVQHAIQKREGFAKGGSPAEQFALRFEEEMRIAKIEANQLLKYRESDSFKGWTKEDKGRIQELKRLFEVDALRKGLAFKEAESQYMRLAGEVEARNVETRALLNPNARREIPPWLTEDTARNLQTVVDEPMWTTPYGPTKTPDVAPSYAPPRNFRRGANDNLPEGHPDRPYNVREPNMIGSKEADDAMESIWSTFAKQNELNSKIDDILSKQETATELEAARLQKQLNKLLDERDKLK